MATQDGKGGAAEHYAPAVVATRPASPPSPPSQGGKSAHGASEVVAINEQANAPEDAVTTVDELEASKKGRFAYFKTKDFYIVLVLGYCILPF